MTLAVHHIAQTVHDGARLAALYAKGAGFAVLAVDDEAQWIAAPNAFIALHATSQAVGPRQASRRVCDPGITHLCIQSGDGEALWRQLDDAGLAFNAAPVALGTGAIYAYGRDPEFNVIEVEGVGDAPAGAPSWVAHVALATPDLDRLADFYARLIGRSVHHRGTFKNRLFEDITGLKEVEVSARWMMADNMIFEIWRYLNPPTLAAPPKRDDEPGYRHIGFAAADLDAERRRLAEAGVAVEDGPLIADLPTIGGVDPDGNRFVILETPPVHALALGGLSNPGIVADRNRHLLTAAD